MSTFTFQKKNSVFILESLMSHLYTLGKDLDLHTVEVDNDLDDRTVESERHIFDYDREERTPIIRKQRVIWALPWVSSMVFDVGYLAECNVPDQIQELIHSRGMNIMFQAIGEDFAVGPFFNRYTKVKTQLENYLEEAEDTNLLPALIAPQLWNIIAKEGGLRLLFEVFDDWIEEIRYELCLKNPYIFASKRDYSHKRNLD